MKVFILILITLLFFPTLSIGKVNLAQYEQKLDSEDLDVQWHAANDLCLMGDEKGILMVLKKSGEGIAQFIDYFQMQPQKINNLPSDVRKKYKD